MKEIKIGKNEEGKRLDSFLKSYLKEASGGFIYKMLRKKNITLNDKKADGNEKLSNGDVIKIFFSDETLIKMKGSEVKEKISPSAHFIPSHFPVIFEDDNIILADKPVGMLTQKAAPDDYSLNEWLIDYLLNKREISEESLETYKPSVCNRLDRNTSGLVICAKSLAGARKMTELIKERAVAKYYRTIVKGKLAESLSLIGYLYKDKKKNIVKISKEAPKDPGYSYIETEYTPVSYISSKDLTELEVKLITGKPHQIRAHLASIGHPIIGDIKYGGPKLSGLNYQLLHSYRLVFPKDMKKPFDDLSDREFIAPLPKDFQRIK